MGLGFANLVMLFGLAALAVPPLIHLLNRRRFDVVDWGAMQFLQVGETVRRRILIEELLLMALRMGVIALIVLGLAMPFAAHPLLADVAGRPQRDIVLILDGSYSMGFADGLHPPPFEETRTWALDFLRDLPASDRVAVLQAGTVPAVLCSFNDGHDEATRRITALPLPRGNSDWPRAVDEARRLIYERGSLNAEIILLRDDQLFGWADPGTLQQWEFLGKKLAADERPLPIQVVTVGPKTTGDAANFSLAPLRTARPLAWPGQRLTFRSALHSSVAGEGPRRIRFEVDGDAVEDVPPPSGPLPRGQVPLSFTHRFRTAGSHLVSLIVEPDLPKDERAADYRLRDCLPGDNRQDLVVEVVRELPVLLVDGAAELSARSASYFLAKALSQGPDPRLAEGIQAKVVLARDFAPEMLTIDQARPRVLVLADVPSLNAAQETAVVRFLDEGGGVLVVLGERVQSGPYNDALFRRGQGWLPARLEETAGDGQQGERAASPEPRRFAHPALEIFREDAGSSLGQAKFPRWWKLEPATGASVWGPLTTGDPWLVSRDVGKGRVLLCSTPLDRSWQSSFPGTWEYPVLVHELIYHLADSRSGGGNLAVGQPLRYRPSVDVGLPASLSLRGPGGETRKFRVESWPWSLDNPGEVGVYRVQVGPVGNRPHGSATSVGPVSNRPEEALSAYFVVQADRRESDLTPCSDEDRRHVSERIPLRYHASDVPVVATADVPRVDVWWIFLLGVTVLLCGEVWFTRRLALSRGGK